MTNNRKKIVQKNEWNVVLLVSKIELLLLLDENCVQISKTIFVPLTKNSWTVFGTSFFFHYIYFLIKYPYTFQSRDTSYVTHEIYSLLIGFIILKLKSERNILSFKTQKNQQLTRQFKNISNFNHLFLDDILEVQL